MTEIIGNAPDWQTFARAASATGQTDEHGVPISGGPLATGGSWFYNAVGPVEGTTGVWARNRFNGEIANLADLIAVWRANGVTIYERFRSADGFSFYWSADGGTTHALDYVQNIGLIA